MPIFLKKMSLWIIPAFLLILIHFNPLYANNFQGITTYYIRFDIKSSNHKITRDRLTMVPAERDYRPENFSLIPVSHTVKGSPGESGHFLENQIKKHAFITLLEKRGLKSIHTMNNDTVISYEGMVCTPVDFRIGPYDENMEGYPYTANIRFAALAFPDKWETMRQEFQIKEILNDFFLLFK